MKAGMYAIQGDGKLVELSEQPYATEDFFQKMLEDHPRLIPGHLINEESPRRWLFIGREYGIPHSDNTGNRWSLDHLMIDQDAIPTLVEVKRSSDTRIRREVVGQLIEYAANASFYWKVEDIRARHVAKCQIDGIDSDAALSEFLGTEKDAEKFWEQLKTNLMIGKVRMLFVADVISSELKRIVEFLNAQMNQAEVLAVEIRQFAGAGSEMITLVPRVLGQTAQAEQKRTSTRRPRMWNEEKFMAAMNADQPHCLPVAEQLLAWANDNDLFIHWGTGTSAGTFGISTLEKGINLFTVYTNGRIEFNFGVLKKCPPYDQPGKLDDLIKQIEAAEISFDHNKDWPNMGALGLRDNLRMQGFLKAFAQVVELVDKSYAHSSTESA